MERHWGEGNLFEFKARADNGRYPIKVAKPVAKFIAEVHNRGFAEVRWLTTWRQFANYEIGRRIGFPPLIQVDDRNDPNWWSTVLGRTVKFGEYVWWKSPAMMNATKLHEGKIVWTDDDLSEDVVEPETWVRDGLLPLAPSSRVGLTRNNLETIAKFLGAEELFNEIVGEKND